MVELLQPLFDLVKEYPLLSLFVSIYFTGDVAFIPALFASFHGFFNPWYVLGAAVLASFISDNGWYLFGRFLRLYNIAPPKRIVEGKTWRKWHSFAEEHTGKALFVTKFMSGIRMPMQFLSGYIRYPYGKYFFYNFSGTLLFFGIILAFAYVARDSETSSFYDPALLFRIGAFLALIFIIQYWFKKYFLKKNVEPVETSGQL